MPFPSLTRSVLGLAAVVLAAGFCVRSAHAGAIISRPLYLGLDQGLVGYWSFEGKTVAGTRVHDVSGQNNHGTMTNGPQTATGKLGQAMEFDGVDDYVSIADHANFRGGQNLTITGWFYSRGNSGESGTRIATKSTGSTSKDWELTLNESNALFRWESEKDDIPYFLDATNVVKLRTWHHFAAVLDKTNDTLSLYLDGIKVAEDTTFGDNSDSTTAIVNIGRRSYTASHFFDGLIDDMRIYNRALSPDEIKRLYKIGATAKVGTTISNDSLQKGLVGHWSFDGGTIAGTRAHDISGQNNHGTMTNGPQTAIGKLGQGMEFDGNDDYVDLGNVSALNFTSSFSLSVWMYTNQVGGAENSVIHKSGGAGNRGWLFRDEFGRVNCGISSDGTALTERYEVGDTPLKTWVHYVCVYNAAAQTLDVYRDGQLSSGDLSGTIPGSIVASTDNARIGRNSGGDRLMNGKIDDVRIYNRALSHDEIKRLYNNGATAKVGVAANTDSLAKGLVGYWNFDGGTAAGTHVYDQSGQGNRGVMTNGPKLAMGKIGQGLEFDGVNDTVVITDPASGILDFGNNSFTISFWMNRRSSPTTEGIVVAKWDGSSGYFCEFFNNNFHLRCFGDGNTNDVFSDVQNVEAGWQHFVWVLDRNAQRAYLYKNNVKVDDDSIAAIGTLGDNTQSFLMGNRSGLAFAGLIDDVRIYNRALNADEIKRLYNMGR